MLLFLIGMNNGLCVNDLIRLKVKDLKGKHQFVIYEGKTNKRQEVNVGMLQEKIRRYTAEKHPETYLFPIQKGMEPITITQVYCILEVTSDFLGRGDIVRHPYYA